MMLEMATLVLAANFTAYPALGDRNIASPPAANAERRVEATTDRGPIVEIIIRCSTGSAIISYSKIERVFCTPRLRCAKSLDETMAQTCR